MASEEHFERLATRYEYRANDAKAANAGDHMIDATDAQVLVLVEEVGELVSAYRAYTNRARYRGNLAGLQTEMADVYISLKILSKMLDIDLDDCVASKMVEIQRRGGI